MMTYRYHPWATIVNHVAIANIAARAGRRRLPQVITCTFDMVHSLNLPRFCASTPGQGIAVQCRIPADYLFFFSFALHSSRCVVTWMIVQRRARLWLETDAPDINAYKVYIYTHMCTDTLVKLR